MPVVESTGETKEWDHRGQLMEYDEGHDVGDRGIPYLPHRRLEEARRSCYESIKSTSHRGLRICFGSLSSDLFRLL